MGWRFLTFYLDCHPSRSASDVLEGISCLGIASSIQVFLRQGRGVLEVAQYP